MNETEAKMQFSIKELEYILWGVGIFLVAGAFWYNTDFLIAVSIGVVIVIVNFVLTRKAVGQLVNNGNTKNKMLFLYLLKMGVSAILIYFAILHFEVSPIGILLGISSLIIAIFLYTIKRILFN